MSTSTPELTEPAEVTIAREHTKQAHSRTTAILAIALWLILGGVSAVSLATQPADFNNDSLMAFAILGVVGTVAVFRRS